MTTGIADSPDAAATKAPYKFDGEPYAWFVVGTLCLTSIVAVLERYMVTLMYEPIKRDFNITDTQVSLLSGFAFVASFVLFGLYFGRLADRKNRKWLISIGVVAWSIATVACGLGRNFTQLLIARVGVGIGEATLNPSAMSLIADYFPRERLSRALSVFSASVVMGAGSAMLFGGAVIAIVDKLPPIVVPLVGQLHAWQATFVLVGVFGSLVLLPLAFVKEPPRKGLLTTSEEARGKGLPLKTVFAFMGKHWKFYVAFFVGFSLANLVSAGTLTWTPSYFIRVHGWTPLEVGSFYGITLTVAGTTSVLAGGWLVEWMDRRGYTDSNLRLSAFAMLIALVPAVLAYMMPWAAASAAFIVVAQVFNGLATAPFIAALQLVTPNEMRGQMMAMFAFFAAIFGSGLGPVVVALFTDYVFQNDGAVGWSIITVLLIAKPTVFALLYWGLKPYSEGLKEANARANNVAAAH